MQWISHFEKISRSCLKNFAFRINRRKTELKRFNLIPEIEMFSHSTPKFPRRSFQVVCEKIWGSFRVGDHFGSCLGRFWGIIWGRGSFQVVYNPSKKIKDSLPACTDCAKTGCPRSQRQTSNQEFVDSSPACADYAGQVLEEKHLVTKSEPSWKQETYLKPAASTVHCGF